MRMTFQGRETPPSGPRAHSGTVQGTGNPCLRRLRIPQHASHPRAARTYAGTRSPVLAEKARTCHDVRRARERGVRKRSRIEFLNLPES